jgi:Kdo2-lipid IVA lauroyltransferase/acyltransferase
VLFVFAERLSRGRGYVLHFDAYKGEDLDETALNRAIEEMVRRCPTQYLWSYNRYKVPHGAAAPPSRDA